MIVEMPLPTRCQADSRTVYNTATQPLGLSEVYAYDQQPEQGSEQLGVYANHLQTLEPNILGKMGDLYSESLKYYLPLSFPGLLCFQYDVNFRPSPGAALINGVANPVACQAECQASTTCEYFNYEIGSSRCKLSSGLASMQRQTIKNFVSGEKNCAV